MITPRNSDRNNDFLIQNWQRMFWIFFTSSLIITNLFRSWLTPNEIAIPLQSAPQPSKNMPHQCGTDHHTQGKSTLPCRSIAGCLKPTKANDLYLLSGIGGQSTLNSRSWNRKTERHLPFHGCKPMTERLMSRQLFTLSWTTEQNN